MPVISKPIPTQEHIASLVTYDAEEGVLYWKPRVFVPGGKSMSKGVINSFNNRFAGKPALHGIGDAGYRRGAFDGETMLAHRIIWKLMTGEDPEQVDHINGVRSDNRWVNLRDVSLADNRKNMGLHGRNSTGFAGVLWDAQRQKWRAEIKLNGRTQHLGRFATKEDAISARMEASKTHGFHENHGQARRAVA